MFLWRGLRLELVAEGGESVV
jgi:hypothetical protein